jgi:hypothetical protein
MTGTVTELRPTVAVDDGRLVWAPVDASRSLDGAWWPATRNAPSELTSLLPLVGDHLGGAVTRVSLNIDDWVDDQPRRLVVGTTLVRVGWFHTLAAASITLARGSLDRVTLLLIPTEYDTATACDLLQHLSTATVWPDDIAAALGKRLHATREKQ